jgi:hypothetical protein
VCIVIGALLIATWAASVATLDALEEGTIVEDLTAKAIETPKAREALVTVGTDKAVSALEDLGVNTSIPGLKLAISAIVEGIVSSDDFVALVHGQTASARMQLIDQLNEGGEGPLVITFDFSDQVNAQLEKIPVIGPSLPDVTVQGVPVQIMDADTADTARTGWDWLHVAKAWFGWLGLGFLALGIVVSYRKRWFFAKVALAVGVISGLLWAAATYLSPQTLAERIPGGGVSDAVIEEIAHHVKGRVTTTMGYVALGAMIVAVVLFTLASRGNKGGRQ